MLRSGHRVEAILVEKLNEGAILSVSSGLLSKALINRGKCRLEERPILDQPEFAADRLALTKLLEQ